MILPSLAKSKKQAQRIVCGNNQKHLSLTHFLYLGENTDRIAPPNYGGAVGAAAPDLSTKQLMGVEQTHQALIAELVRRADAGDARACVELSRIEPSRSQ